MIVASNDINEDTLRSLKEQVRTMIGVFFVRILNKKFSFINHSLFKNQSSL